MGLPVPSVQQPVRVRVYGNKVHYGEVKLFVNSPGREILASITVGVDLAKNLFATTGWHFSCWKPRRISRREKIPRLKRIKFNQAEKGGYQIQSGGTDGGTNPIKIL